MKFKPGSLLTSTQRANRRLKWGWLLDFWFLKATCQGTGVSKVRWLADKWFWLSTLYYEGSLTSTKCFSVPKPNFDEGARSLFSVDLLLLWMTGWTEAWWCMLWRAVWILEMNTVLCLASSQGGKRRGFPAPKPQPCVPGNPPQSHLILTPCLA